MKRFYIIVALFSSFIMANSQSRSFIEEGKTWLVEYTPNIVVVEPDFPLTYKTYTISGDTVIDGESWKRMTHSSIRADGAEKTATQLVALLREENGKVYCRNDKEVHMIYDFTARESETINYYNMDMWRERECKVISTGTFSYGGQDFREILIQDKNPMDPRREEDEQARMSWIEGIGTWYGPINNGRFDMAGSGLRLLECKVNGEVLYRHDDYTGISSATVLPASDRSALYGIDGRRLSEKPAHGFYIEGGVKKMAK
ncbi:MAG TPA: hypothetical protein PLN34_01380 [Alloprevotella sp.]|nr:hypothetical protein [Alloprevotella sp.]